MAEELSPRLTKVARSSGDIWERTLMLCWGLLWTVVDRGYWPQRRAVLCVEMRLLVDWSGKCFHLKMSLCQGKGVMAVGRRQKYPENNTERQPWYKDCIKMSYDDVRHENYTHPHTHTNTQLNAYKGILPLFSLYTYTNTNRKKSQTQIHKLKQIFKHKNTLQKRT